MSLCRPIKTGISAQCAVHHRGVVQRISGCGVHQRRAHSMRCISSRPARIGSLAPPNCWSNTRTKIPAATTSQDFLHFSSQKNGEIVAESLEALGWGHVNRKYLSVCLSQPNMVRLSCQCGSLGKAHFAVCPAATFSEHISTFFFAFYTNVVF